MCYINKKLIVFDLDGTLSNTLEALTEAVNLTFEYFGYNNVTSEQVRQAIGNGARKLMERLMPVEDSKNCVKVNAVLEKYNLMYSHTYMHTDKMYEGIEEAIKLLHSKNKKIAVFSNKQDEYVKALTDMYFPGGEISFALGQTDLPVKPDISGLKLILSELNVSADECIFVGDSGVDLETARNASMDFIGVAWGFLGREKLLRLGTENIVETPMELVNMIK